jgi:hypothetical protein
VWIPRALVRALVRANLTQTLTQTQDISKGKPNPNPNPNPKASARANARSENAHRTHQTVEQHLRAPSHPTPTVVGKSVRVATVRGSVT